MTQPAIPTNTLRHLRLQPSRSLVPINLRELWDFRDLFGILAMRDVKLRYKQTLLGVVWVILQPLVASLIFATIFGRIASLPSDNRPYLLFVYAGMLPWNLFSGSLQRAGNSLISDARLISKVYFPRIVIPVASTVAVLIDFLVAFVVMIALLILYHEQAPLTLNILALPLLLLITIVFSVGVSLFLSALNVYYRDFMYALPFIIQAWMYASPVVYSTTMIQTSSKVPDILRFLYMVNPMTGIIDAFRWSLLGANEFPWLSMAFSVVITILCMLGGLYVFQRVEDHFADVI